MSILRADSIRDRAGTGAPDFPNGATVTGVVTATSFSGALTGNADTATSATSATTATNAQGLTGTPNITVGTVGCSTVTSSGDVTGVNATFSGNLTVQGTTTTIDTAVTSVDSLKVDGKVGIGTNIITDNSVFVELVADSSQVPRLQFDNKPAVGTNDGEVGGFLFRNNTDSVGYILCKRESAADDGYIQFGTQPTGGGVTERLRITSTGTAIFKAGLAEKNVNGTTLAAASNNIALSSGNVHRFTGNESGAKTVNFTGVHSTLANGESVSFTVILTPNNSGYINAATVDGVAPGISTKWSGGSAPSAGGASGRDVYTFTIFKYGTATNEYEVYGAVTNYA